MLHEFGKNTVGSSIFSLFMRPKRTNSVKKYKNASRLKKKSAIRPTLPYMCGSEPAVTQQLFHSIFFLIILYIRRFIHPKKGQAIYRKKMEAQVRECAVSCNFVIPPLRVGSSFSSESLYK